MKLLTEISGNDDDVILVCNGDIDVSGDDQLEHDAACAHALMMAMDEWWSASDEHGLDEQQSPRETVQWIEARAQAILREWGFDSGEDA